MAEPSVKMLSIFARVDAFQVEFVQFHGKLNTVGCINQLLSIWGQSTDNLFGQDRTRGVHDIFEGEQFGSCLAMGSLVLKGKHDG